MGPSAVLLAVALLTSGCLILNPSYDNDGSGAATSMGTTTSTTSTTSTPSTTSTTSTSEASGTGSASGGATTSGLGGSEATTSTSSATGASDTSGATGLVIFDPIRLQAYTQMNCGVGVICADMMGNPIPAFQRDVECFSAPVDPPFVVTRVGFEVRFAIKMPVPTLRIHGFDAQNGAVLDSEFGSAPLGAIDQSGGYREFTVQEPILVTERDFCVSVEGGGVDAGTVFSLRTDSVTGAPGEAFVAQDAASMQCDVPLKNLRDMLKKPSAHYCIDVTIAPP